MKTGIAMVQDGYGLINVIGITSLINGGVYLFERPQNSKLIDIVLNTLALTNDQLQQGVFNINVHCPNLNGLVVNGKTDNTQPDIASLNTIGNAVMTLVDDYTGYDFSLSALNTGIPLRDSDGSWYLNIRVTYYAFQPNYTNI